jgi:hypothetical protein
MHHPVFLHYVYYRCTKSRLPRCRQKYISEQTLEEQIDAFLSRITISEKFKQWAVKYLHELHLQEYHASKEVLKTQQKAHEECLRRLENLIRLRTSANNVNGSMISDEEYGIQRQQLLKEKAALESVLQSSDPQQNSSLRLSEEAFIMAETARERFTKGDHLVKKEILLAVALNLSLRDKKLSFEAKKPFVLLEGALRECHCNMQTFEPENHETPQGSNCRPLSENPFRCASPDDVRTCCSTRAGEAVAQIYHFYRDSGKDAAQHITTENQSP